MATKQFELRDRTAFSFDETKVEFRDGEEIRLLKKNATTGVYDPTHGKYREAATVEFPNFVAKGLTSLFGLDEIASNPEDEWGTPYTSIDYQVSVDDGVTWLFWTGAAWAAAGASDFSPASDLDTNLNSLAFTGAKQFKLKARLNPSSDLLDTPSLKGLLLHHEVRVNWFEDVQRSLRAYLLANFKARLSIFETLRSASTTVVVNTDFRVDSVVAVFNETTDPGRNSNIYQSKAEIQTGTDENGDPVYKTTITLTASQASGSVLYIVFLGVPPIIIAPADEELHLAVLPALVFRVESIEEHLPSRNFDRKVENNFGRNKARIRNQPTYYEAPTIVSCSSENDLNAINMSESLKTLLKSPAIEFDSIETGEPIAVLEITPFADAAVRPLGLAVKEATFVLYGQKPDESFTEKDDAYADELVLESHLQVGGQT